MHPANQPIIQPFPLHAAARAGDLHATDALMKSPCRTLNVNALDRAGATPLLYAVHYGHTGVAARLLAAGANPNRPVSCPPLHAAARAGASLPAAAKAIVTAGLKKFSANIKHSVATVQPATTLAYSCRTVVRPPSPEKLAQASV